MNYRGVAPWIAAIGLLVVAGAVDAAGQEKWTLMAAERTAVNPVSYWEHLSFFLSGTAGRVVPILAAVIFVFSVPNPQNAILLPRRQNFIVSILRMANSITPRMLVACLAWALGGALYYFGSPTGTSWGPNLGIDRIRDFAWDGIGFESAQVSPIALILMSVASACAYIFTFTIVGCFAALVLSQRWAQGLALVIALFSWFSIELPGILLWVSPKLWSGTPATIIDLPSALSYSLVVVAVGVAFMLLAVVVDAIRAGRLLPEGVTILAIVGGAYMLATLIFPHLSFSQGIMAALQWAMGGGRVGLESPKELTLLETGFLATQCLVAIPMVLAYFYAESIRDLGPGMWVRGGAQWRLVTQYFPSILRVSGLVLGVLVGVVVLGLLGVPAAITNLTGAELADVAWVLALTFGQMVFGATLVMVVRAHTNGPFPAVTIGIILFALPMFVQTRFVPSGQGHPLYVAQSSTVENLMSAGVLLVSIALALALAVLFPRLRFRSLEDAS